MGCNLTHTSRNLMEPSKGMKLQFTLLGEEISPLEFLPVLWGTKLTLLQSFDTKSGFLNVNLIISLFSCKYFNDIFFFSVCFLKKKKQHNNTKHDFKNILIKLYLLFHICYHSSMFRDTSVFHMFLTLPGMVFQN